MAGCISAKGSSMSRARDGLRLKELLRLGRFGWACLSNDKNSSFRLCFLLEYRCMLLRGFTISASMKHQQCRVDVECVERKDKACEPNERRFH